MTASIKKLLIALSILTIGIGAIGQTSAIKTGPAGYAFGTIGACYERASSDHSSFQFTILPYHTLTDYDGVSYGASAEYRLYITKKEVLHGFYIAPKLGISLGSLTEKDTSLPKDAISIFYGANLGYQWIWSSGILVDISLGPKYAIGQGDKTASEFEGVSPDVNFAIGYAF